MFKVLLHSSGGPGISTVHVGPNPAGYPASYSPFPAYYTGWS